MQCSYCVYWVTPEYDQPGWREWCEISFNSRPGKCSLRPVWVETLGRHWCGQIVTSTAYRYQQRLADEHAALVGDENDRLRGRLKTLEARKKALNEQVRALKRRTG